MIAWDMRRPQRRMLLERGLLACARSDRAAGQTLNIGGPARSLREFLGAVAAAAGVRLRTTPMLENPARGFWNSADLMQAFLTQLLKTATTRNGG
jgi:nucleoside-diphosphate-sugar epimerase